MGVNLNVQHTDRQIIFRSAGDLDFRVGEGVAVTATGDPKNNNAVVHGTVVGILINNPA